ncbi:MAG TPA: type II secretion system protein GspG, partial [Phycisphaerae bacterium]|nr:type II secretion system protein GspG [Phycisphaerae bacterium]
GLPKDVRWLRIDVHAYWPPGNYYFDNVNLCKDPRQKAPLDEAKPRTPGFEGKQSATGPADVSWRVKRQIDLTRVKIADLAAPLDTFRLHLGRYPTEAEGLLALVGKPTFKDTKLAEKWGGPYATRMSIEDAWGSVLEYRLVKDKGTDRVRPRVYSRGPDGTDQGGQGDDVRADPQ